MKKYIIALLMFIVVGVGMPLLAPVEADAQTYVRRVVRNGRVRYVRTRKPSFYRRHRNASNIAIGTGAGAIIGGLIGGKKGALIGAGTGAGGSALYTYKLKPKKRRYYRVRN